MKKDINLLIEKLNAPTKKERLSALKDIIALEKAGEIEKPATGTSVNNHIHTIYSFSPYSPTKALYMARKAGLVTAGIMDHDSVGGCEEFVEAGKIAGMDITCGFECRVSIAGTSLYGRRLNNPDQISVAYVAIHGIPHQKFAECEKFLAPYRAKRNERNRKMTENISRIVAPFGLTVDFDADVVPLSQNANGGSITERHLIYALVKKIIAKYGKGQPVVDLVKNDFKIPLSAKIEGFLLDVENPCYEYDLLGALKSDFVAKFYIDADEECPPVKEFVAFAKKIGAISAYAYLGDVGNSVTGDKKTQKFEDDYIEELFEVIKKIGFNAVTYMPSRNTPEQLQRIISLCDQHGFFQISGEDINTPRQSFICPALEKPEYAHLSTATWVLIGHEKAATANEKEAMFSDWANASFATLDEKIDYYYKKGNDDGNFLKK